MNRVTKSRWAPRLKAEADTLDEVFEEAIANPKLSMSLKELSKLYGERDPGRYAPFFHFAKRLVRKHPDMWAEAERLEAEIRFAAGLFLPFLLLFIDGLLLGPTHKSSAWVLVVIGAFGASLMILAFPSKRVKEVLYNHFLALAILLDPVHRGTANSEKGDGVKPAPESLEAPNTGPQAGSYAAA
jgi:hypothetical protein